MVEVSEEDWDRVMTVNVKTMVLAAKAVIPRMMQTGGGSIINISSIAGLRAHMSTPYTASKAGVIGLTISMAADHAQDNIRVNAIAPGLVYTPMVAPRMDDDLRQYRRNSAPMQVEGTGWDIGYAALFLASDEARWITGIVLPVDAGLCAVHPGTYSPMSAADAVLGAGFDAKTQRMPAISARASWGMSRWSTGSIARPMSSSVVAPSRYTSSGPNDTRATALRPSAENRAQEVCISTLLPSAIRDTLDSTGSMPRPSSRLPGIME